MKVDDFIKLVEASRRKNFLFHFTAATNLDLIRKHGLLSKQQQEAMSIICPYPGGDKVSHFSDRQRGIFNDVSLSFTDNHPMAYICRETKRQEHQVYLYIDLAILKTPKVRVANGMANAKSTEIFPLEEGLDQLDLEVLFNQPPWSEDVKKRLNLARKYEILIPNSVPVHLIKHKKMA